MMVSGLRKSKNSRNLDELLIMPTLSRGETPKSLSNKKILIYIMSSFAILFELSISLNI